MKEFEVSLSKKTKKVLIDIMYTMGITPLNVNQLRKDVLIKLIMVEINNIVSKSQFSHLV